MCDINRIEEVLLSPSGCDISSPLKDGIDDWYVNIVAPFSSSGFFDAKCNSMSSPGGTLRSKNPAFVLKGERQQQCEN